MSGGATPTGGSSTGGQPSGGTNSGGSTTGGTSSGGAETGGMATGGADTGGTSTETGGDGGCPHEEVSDNETCTIGDSWIQIPGNQVTHLEELMRDAGAIGAGESFSRREQSGAPQATLIGQHERDRNGKILIMDGGGIDLFSTPLGDQNAIQPVVQRFEDFLQEVADDGNVQHIIYSLYPVIPTTPDLNENMGPDYTAACDASPVDGHLVDLEPLFHGQHFGSDQTHPDNQGGIIIAEAWWQAMQDNCLAQ